jgi:hypothetical protein
MWRLNQKRPRSAFKAPLIEHEIALGSAPLEVIPAVNDKKNSILSGEVR